MTAITRPDGVVVSYTYDSAGRRHTISHPHDTITLGYDPSRGTLTSVATPSVAMAHGYDGALRTSTTWSGAVAGSVAHTFDTRFRVSTEAVNGSSPVGFGYDADSLLTSAGALSLTRGPHGMVTATSLGVVTEAITYTTFGELESRTTRVSGSDLLKLSYTRDALGRIATKTEVEGSVAHVFEYRYDLVGRLDQVKKDGAVVATYTYDANGNRLTKVTPSGTESGTYDAQDRMLTYGGASYTYNANGDLVSKTDSSGTTSFVYDALGNLRSVTPPSGSVIEYVIDGANRRVGKKVGGVLVQQFLYSSDLRIVAELNGSSAVVSRFVYGTRVNVPEYVVKGGNTYRVVTDHLGSVRKVVETATGSVAQKIEYDEFGVVLSDSAPGFQPFGFAGGLVDASTGLVRFGARDYEARSGRWTSKDPALVHAGTGLFVYTENDPQNLVDLGGHEPWAPWPTSGEPVTSFICEFLPLLCGPPKPASPPPAAPPRIDPVEYPHDLPLPGEDPPAPPDPEASIGGTCKDPTEAARTCDAERIACELTGLASYPGHLFGYSRCDECYEACIRAGGNWLSKATRKSAKVRCDYWNYRKAL